MTFVEVCHLVLLSIITKSSARSQIRSLSTSTGHEIIRCPQNPLMNRPGHPEDPREIHLPNAPLSSTTTTTKTLHTGTRDAHHETLRVRKSSQVRVSTPNQCVHSSPCPFEADIHDAGASTTRERASVEVKI